MTAVERFCREVRVDLGTLRNGERKDGRTQNYLGCWWKNAFSRYQLHTHTAYDVPLNGRGERTPPPSRWPPDTRVPGACGSAARAAPVRSPC